MVEIRASWTAAAPCDEGFRADAQSNASLLSRLPPQ